MGYVESNLVEGEEIGYRARVHWVRYIRPGLLCLAGLALAVAGVMPELSAGAGQAGSAGSAGGAGAAAGGPAAGLAHGAWNALGLVGAFMFLLGLTGCLLARIYVMSSEFAVTNRRVLIKIGLVRRHTLELLLTKVEGIGVDQGFWGRVLGFGTITVTGTGGTRESFRDIARPLEFRKQVQTRVPV
ncbi:MAG: PH domain-containing protein [Candidatus Eisenbacteria bacterium]|nr:PH domain-containing protein [Candidatus Eisenbacteria bacterium]